MAVLHASRPEGARRAGGYLGRLLLLLLPPLCLLAWLVPTGRADGAPSAHRSASAPLGGLSVGGVFSGESPSAADREIADARALHAKVVRVELPWSVFEPSAPHQIDASALAYTDHLMNDAESAGIGVVALVQSTPCWASSAPAAVLQSCAGESSRAHAWPPSDPATYASFVAFLAQRYGAALTAIEVWNEPDQSNEFYFAGPQKPQRYAAVLRAAYTAIKQANPHVLVLGGSLVGSNGLFLRALYAAGIKGFYDGLSVHFYTLALGSLRAIHEVQVANGDTKPLWLNEFGWTSCWPGQRIEQEQPCVTPATQAANLADTFRSLARTPYVAGEIVYSLFSSKHEDFGVLSTTGARKPSFGVLSKVLSNPFGSPSRVTLSLKRHAGRVQASGSGPVGDYMELEAFRGSALRYTSLFVLDRFNRYSITLPRALGTSGLRVRVFQYWAGRSKGAQKRI